MEPPGLGAAESRTPPLCVVLCSLSRKRSSPDCPTPQGAVGRADRGGVRLWFQSPGDLREGSDADVLIVLRDRDPGIENEIMEIFVQEALENGLVFTPVIKDQKAFEQEKRLKTPFTETSLRRDPVVRLSAQNRKAISEARMSKAREFLVRGEAIPDLCKPRLLCGVECP